MPRTNDPITVRCSALPRIMSCPASAKTPDVLINSAGEAATVGTAAHEFYERMVNDGLTTPEGIEEIALKHNVDLDELTMLAWQGLKIWSKLKDHITDPKCEEGLRTGGGLNLTGHPDVIGGDARDAKNCVIIDWKTGHLENNPTAQLKGYALLALHNGYDDHVGYETYTIITAWTRLGFTDVQKFAIDEIGKFWIEINDTIFNPKEVFNPTPENCMYCPRQNNCEGRRDILQAAGRDLIALADVEGREITPTTLAVLYPQSRMIKKALENYETMLKDAVRDAGGSIAYEGGEIALIDKERKTISFNQEIFGEYLTPEEIQDVTEYTVKADRFKKAVMGNAPRGQKKTHLDECLAKLEEAGSVNVSKYQQLVSTKTKKEELE